MNVGGALPSPAQVVRAVTEPTTPARLRLLGAVLVIGCLLFGVASAFSGMSLGAAVGDAATRVTALNTDAAQLYGSLADADAMATSGYAAGGIEPPAIRSRYDDDISRATSRLVQAAGRLPERDPALQPIGTIANQLPTYTSLIDTARVYNRQALPLGQTYLESGSELMRTTLLPAAEQLRLMQAASFEIDYRRGAATPWSALLLGAAALAAVADVALRERRRTNRLLNIGLLVAGTALLCALFWWVGALLLAGHHLAEAKRYGASAATLDAARAAVLQARSNENLVLVARSGEHASDAEFTAQLTRVLGPDGYGGLLAQAGPDHGGPADPREIAEIRAAATAWQDAHRRLRELDDRGDYAAALASATGTDPIGSGIAFLRLDATLGGVADTQRRAFDDELDAAAADLDGLTTGPSLLAVVAAAAVATGLGRRIAEYR